MNEKVFESIFVKVELKHDTITCGTTHSSVASSAVFSRNWASFDEALLEKFSSRGWRFLGYFLPSRSAILD